MRVIGYIEHPHLKISIFKMENRISLKLENARYEQTFKLGDDERFATVEAVEKLVDALFLEQAVQQFQAMHHATMAALSRNFPMAETTEYEEII